MSLKPRASIRKAMMPLNCFDSFSTEYSTSAECNEFLFSGEKGERASGNPE
jgi:hypothetical protein